MSGCDEHDEAYVHDPIEDGSAGLDDANAMVAPEDQPFRHPLVGMAENADGEVPLGTTFDSPQGKRYAYVFGSKAMPGDAEAEHYADLVELDMRPVTAGELHDLDELRLQRHGPKLVPVVQTQAQRIAEKLGPSLMARIEAARSSVVRGSGAEERIEVLVALRKLRRPTLNMELERAIALGEVESQEDFFRLRDAILESRREESLHAAQPALDAIEARGGEVLDAEGGVVIRAEIPVASLEGLAARDDVTAFMEDSATAPEVHGLHVTRGHQVEQFIAAGQDGENGGPSNWDITFAMIEAQGLHNEHPGYKESRTLPPRIRELYNCDPTGCTPTLDYTPAQTTAHGNMVASILFGDLRDGQDPTVPNATERKELGGIAGEARAFYYRAPVFAGVREAFLDIQNQGGPTRPEVVNMSLQRDPTRPEPDPKCQGRDLVSQAANELYENGMLVIKSAGNEGHLAPNDCTVTAPGSALGVFTVGAIGNDPDGLEDDVRRGVPFTQSSRGGTAMEGGGRNIVDLAASGCREGGFDTFGGYSFSPPERACGTSYAAPAVTGTAINFIDWFIDVKGNAIRSNPGLLAANLLLMGDRGTETGATSTAPLDPLFGAGRLRARKFDDAGMDYPWDHQTSMVCVNDGSVVQIPVNGGNPLLFDVDAFKAALWWYTPGHDTDPTGFVDDVDLVLRDLDSGVIVEHSVSRDNKERLFAAPGGVRVALELVGVDVRSDFTGCGTDSIPVHWAWFYEDSDRDDSNGPGTDIWSEDFPTAPPPCSPPPTWVNGHNYAPGDLVTHEGDIYQCKPWPHGLWCQLQGYEPDTFAGDTAWDRVGPACSP